MRFLLPPSPPNIYWGKTQEISKQSPLQVHGSFSPERTMAVASPLNSKSCYHIRSISFPCKFHPIISQLDEHLCRLRSSEPASAPSSLSNKLRGLQDLHECVEKLLLLPLTQQNLATQECQNELLNGSIRVLDLCNMARDALLQAKSCTHKLQSTIRRKGNDELELSNGVKEYLNSRKKSKREIYKALKNLKGEDNKWRDGDQESMAAIRVLGEVESISLEVLQSLVSFIVGPRAQHGNWSLVSKLLRTKSVASAEDRLGADEFEAVDAILNSLICGKTNKYNNIGNVQTQLEKLESSVEDLEEGLECLFRHLIRTRVSLLNILSH